MIIGICGHKGSGKDYLANILKQYTNYKITHFADPIKDILCEVFKISKDELNKLKNDENTKILGTNMRSILQTFGTDIMQNMFGKRVWADLVLKDDNLIVADVRFQHEIDAILEKGGFVIKLKSNFKEDKHISESGIEELPESSFKYIFDNSKKDSSILDFAYKVYGDLNVQ